MATHEKCLSYTDIRKQILALEDSIDDELSKGEKADMPLVDAYFRRIRELDGGVYEKSEEAISRELNKIQARTHKKRTHSGVLIGYLPSVAKRAAAILIFIGIFSGFSAGVYAARDSIVKFLSNTYDKYIEIFFDSNDIEKAPTKIETVYPLELVPEGYTQENAVLNEVRSSITWVNDKNHRIVLTQTVLDGNITVDNEHSELGTVEMNGMTVIYIVTQHYRYYFWNTNEYQFSLDLSTEISHEMALNMIDSMVKFN